jgi:hypothetical protein
MTANITRIRNSKEMTKTFKHKKTELTESFLKGSVSSVISCEEVTSGGDECGMRRGGKTNRR